MALQKQDPEIMVRSFPVTANGRCCAALDGRSCSSRSGIDLLADDATEDKKHEATSADCSVS